jgi:TolA-binding protein
MNTDLSTKAAFLQGRSLVNLEQLDEASQVFRAIYTREPDSGFADDALFESASILAEQGRWSDAAATYGQLADRYAGSPLAEEALYKRAEVLGSAGEYQKAKDAYLEYRRRFPKGRLVDASLYWGGLASSELGEKFEAVLQWERLIETYPESPFVVDALRRTADAYADRGDYRRAIQLYTSLNERFPEEARSYGVPRRLDELRFQLQGLSDREAVLSSIIGREGGARTQKGREAMIELSRMYIYEGSGRVELAFQMLQSVVEKKDPATTAQSEFLLGEYYYRKNNPVKASEEFLKAAYTNPEDRDLMAASIYRAAEMMSLAGRRADVQELVGRLEQHFPGSPWTAEARKLTEGGSR